jgi:subtilisin family serine protease
VARVIKALDCAGSGTIYSVASGITYVQDQCANASPPYPVVLSMSLSGPQSSTLDQAVTDLQNACHISIVSAAGNQNDNACNYSPGDVATSLTVGATTPTDARATYSNHGSCVDLYAPGGDAGANPVTSAWYTSDTATEALSGTSMGTPLVAATAGLLQRERMDSGYVLGGTNLGLQVNADLLARVRGGSILFNYFTVSAAPSPSPPPPPALPPQQAPPPPVPDTVPQQQQQGGDVTVVPLAFGLLVILFLL